MNRILTIMLVLASIGIEPHFAQSGILSSQLGYELGYPIRVMIRSNQSDYLSNEAIFDVVNMENESVISGLADKWGKKWESYWWTADLSHLEHQGSYIVKINNKDHVLLTSDIIEVGRNLLWSECIRRWKWPPAP